MAAHFSIMLVLLLVPLLFLSYKRPEGPNRFGETPSPAGFMEAVQRSVSNYFNFSGRASRSEFWYVMLFFAAVSFLLGLINVSDIVFSLWTLSTIVPLLSVAARRMHDTNRSGWLQLASWFTPVGTIIAILWFCEPSRD